MVNSEFGGYHEFTNSALYVFCDLRTKCVIDPCVIKNKSEVDMSPFQGAKSKPYEGLNSTLYNLLLYNAGWSQVMC